MPLIYVSELGSEDPWRAWCEIISGLGLSCWSSQVPQCWRTCLPMQEMQVWSLVWEDPWRRKWQPASVFLPGKSHGQRSLMGYNPWGHKEWDTIEWLNNNHHCVTAHGATHAETTLGRVPVSTLHTSHLMCLSPRARVSSPQAPPAHPGGAENWKRKLLQDTCAGEPWGKGAPLQNFSKVIFVWEIVSSHLGWISSWNFYFPSSPSLLSFLSHFFFNWSVADLQCWIHFRCTAEWFGHAYMLF